MSRLGSWLLTSVFHLYSPRLRLLTRGKQEPLISSLIPAGTDSGSVLLFADLICLDGLVCFVLFCLRSAVIERVQHGASGVAYTVPPTFSWNLEKIFRSSDRRMCCFQNEMNLTQPCWFHLFSPPTYVLYISQSYNQESYSLKVCVSMCSYQRHLSCCLPPG